ncbi:tRNA dihydrouridine(20/20a) synthase DusA [Paracoccus suum]|uniref:tRNA-dihydrouridine(20/20a) synthase n=1 Tax=Paracoccus suum TaxID=2259340 RepID=A0A344PJJ9_9RHOB|nr:tRNA dihydrouridine(20/20a) synthase DusA [Paracoccus suum]AXC49554.1 tRNA dihydrouridine(20/20a) synthase DusA [Paracoccus suum]
MTEYPAHRFSVAPMMDWTDHQCRAFHRLLSRRALLYTEMVTAAAIVHGDRDRMLGFDREAEGQVALQLGGSDPALLAKAVLAARAWPYVEMNLNVGCPSDRVQSGCFGAALMRDPGLVGDCVAAMQDAAGGVEVTVKCRIGVDDQNPDEVLPAFLQMLSDRGVRRVTIHARKAWLQGLSPRENREIPPLDYPLVHAMREAFPDMHLSINGGIASLAAAVEHLGVMNGVMVGRAAYHQPWDVLGAADTLWGEAPPLTTPLSAAEAMRPRIAAHLAAGGRLHQITRHMLGLFHGQPGARGWKRTLSEAGPTGDLRTYDFAMAAVA